MITSHLVAAGSELQTPADCRRRFVLVVLAEDCRLVLIEISSKCVGKALGISSCTNLRRTWWILQNLYDGPCDLTWVVLVATNETSTSVLSSSSLALRTWGTAMEVIGSKHHDLGQRIPTQKRGGGQDPAQFHFQKKREQLDGYWKQLFAFAKLNIIKENEVSWVSEAYLLLCHFHSDSQDDMSRVPMMFLLLSNIICVTQSLANQHFWYFPEMNHWESSSSGPEVLKMLALSQH